MVIDYVCDVAVKRSMALGPTRAVGAVGRVAWQLVHTHGLGVYTGLSAKTMEFGTSYFVTGMVSVHVVAALTTDK